MSSLRFDDDATVRCFVPWPARTPNVSNHRLTEVRPQSGTGVQDWHHSRCLMGMNPSAHAARDHPVLQTAIQALHRP